MTMNTTKASWVRADSHQSIHHDPFVSESLLLKKKVKNPWEQSQLITTCIPKRPIALGLLNHDITSSLLFFWSPDKAQWAVYSDAVDEVVLVVGPRSFDQPHRDIVSEHWFTHSDSQKVKYRNKAIQMLKDIEEYLEEDDQRPPPDLVDGVEQLVIELFKVVTLPVHVDGTPEGDILVTVFNQKGDSLMVYCDAGGIAQCRIKLHGQSEKRNFDSIYTLSNSLFVRESLRSLSY